MKVYRAKFWDLRNGVDVVDFCKGDNVKEARADLRARYGPVRCLFLRVWKGEEKSNPVVIRDDLPS
jgi:hypothetical protein